MDGLRESEVVIVAENGISGLDARERQNIVTAARWAKFIAIVQFVMLGLGVAGMVFMLLGMGIAGVTMPGMYGSMMGPAMIIMFVCMLIIMLAAFLPALFMFRAANRALAAVEDQNTEAASDALLNLKRMFKFQGILLIVSLVMYLLIMTTSFVAGLGGSI
jgi:hypothetical protein